jgi:hypothetical protein
LVLTTAALLALGAAAAVVEEAVEASWVLVADELAAVVLELLLPQPPASRATDTAATPSGKGCLNVTSWSLSLLDRYLAM